MKTLSVQEPYASAIRCGKKKIETRSWGTKYRGEMLIHASRTWWNTTDEFNDYLVNELGVDTYRMGVVHCKARLVDCIKMTDEFINSISEQEKKLGFYEPGRYAWVLEDVEPYDINKQEVVKGQLGLWERR